MERAYTPLPQKYNPNYRIVLEMSHSSAEATSDEEECFDISTDSLESSCKRMRLNSSLDSLETQSHVPEVKPDECQDEGLPNIPESPDESLCSDVFVVEEPSNHEESITSSRVLEYLEQVRQENSSSYFVTPPRQLNFLPASPLNNLGEPRKPDETTASRTESTTLTFLPRQTGELLSPEEWSCRSPLPVWVAAVKELELGEDMDAAYASQVGILGTNLNFKHDLEINCD